MSYRLLKNYVKTREKVNGGGDLLINCKISMNSD